MRILSHYFVARFLGLFLIVVVAGFAILATVELVLGLEELAAAPPAQAAPGASLLPNGPSGPTVPSGSSGPSGPSGPFARVVEYLWLRLATTYLADLLPVASFIASFLTFALAGRRLEGIAIQANGIRLARVILPVLLAAGVLSVADALVHESIVLRATRTRLAEARVDRNDFDLERRAFWYHKGPIITNIGYADPTTRTLHDVELFERGMGDDSGRILRIVRAAEVRILPNGVWSFERASVWRFDPADPFGEPRFTPTVGLEIDLDSIPEDTLARADPAILPIRALADHLERVSADPSSPPDRRLEEVLHERLSRPWRMLALCWLGVPFGLRVDRRGRIAPAAAAALLALTAYLACSSGASALTRLGGLPVGVATWAVPTLFALLGALVFPRRPR